MLAEHADVLSRDKLAAAVTATAVLPTLYVTIALRRFQPKAKTPVVPTLIALALAVAGVAAALLAKPAQATIARNASTGAAFEPAGSETNKIS